MTQFSSFDQQMMALAIEEANQALYLSKCNLSPTHHKTGLSMNSQKNRQKIHRQNKNRLMAKWVIQIEDERLLRSWSRNFANRHSPSFNTDC